MPGFNICGEGFGPSARTEVRRKHRWVFETLSIGNSGDQFEQDELLYLLKAQRPHLKFEEPTMHHDQEQAYYAGKHSWEPVTMSWYDIEQDPDISQRLWDWAEAVVDFSRACVNPPSMYKGEAKLSMISGCSGSGAGGGNAGGARITESWLFCNCWPKDLNWGDLDYADTELATIEATMRFDRAKKLPVNG